MTNTKSCNGTSRSGTPVLIKILKHKEVTGHLINNSASQRRNDVRILQSPKNGLGDAACMQHFRIMGVRRRPWRYH
ncbi:hypothetical protein FHG87_018834 [Trinorchestia longiramus]|nr:hypothetical protein FHG87_018834 [Trinorchestia longiramus]